MLTERDIAHIADLIARHMAPLAVGIFGSYAVGTAREGSDLDLFIIEDNAERPAIRSQAVRRLLFGVMNPLDIHVFTPEMFEEAAHEHLSFAWVIARQAKLYHVAQDAERLVPSLFPTRNAPSARLAATLPISHPVSGDRPRRCGITTTYDETIPQANASEPN